MMSVVTTLWLVTDFLISCFIERKLITYPEFLAKFPQLLNLRPLLHGGSCWTRRERRLMRMWTFEKDRLDECCQNIQNSEIGFHFYWCISNWAELKDLFPVFSLYHFKVTHTPLLPLLSSVLLGLSTERSFAAAPRISFTVETRQVGN